MGQESKTDKGSLHCVRVSNDVVRNIKVKLETMQTEHENLNKMGAVLAAKCSETEVRLNQLIEATKELKSRYE